MHDRIAVCRTNVCSFVRVPAQTASLLAGTSSSQDLSLSRSTCTWQDAGK